MGWWLVDSEENIEVGDVVFDELRHFLVCVSKCYEEDLGRKPTIEELQYLLSLGLSVNANSDILSNFDELRVQKILIKTEKRKKRVKPKIGDIFYFKIDADQYGFGRLVFNLDLGTIAEIFNYTSKQPIFDYSKGGEWLMSPILINDMILLDAAMEGDWGVIGSNAEYKADARFDDVYFSWRDYKGEYILEGVRAPKGRVVSQDVAKKYPAYVTKDDAAVRKLVIEALRNR